MIGGIPGNRSGLMPGFLGGGHVNGVANARKAIFNYG